MRPYFFIRSLPEVRHLDADDRARIRLDRFAALKLLVLPIVSGMGPVALGVTLVYTGSLAPLGYGLVVLGVLLWLAIHCLLIEDVRRGIHEEIQRAQQSGDRVVCLHCGYDLRGCKREACPECGRTLDQGDR
jgi:uncharacterized paraquat-inducible protein A